MVTTRLVRGFTTNESGQEMRQRPRVPGPAHGWTQGRAHEAAQRPSETRGAIQSSSGGPRKASKRDKEEKEKGKWLLHKVSDRAR